MPVALVAKQNRKFGAAIDRRDRLQADVADVAIDAAAELSDDLGRHRPFEENRRTFYV